MAAVKSLEDRVSAVESDLAKKGSKVEGVSVTGSTISYYEDASDGNLYGASQVRSRVAYETQVKRGRLMQRISELSAKGYKNPEIKSLQDQLKGVAHAAKGSGQAGRSYMEAYQAATNSLARAVGLNTFEGDSAGSLVLPEFAPSIMDREYTNDLWSRTDGYVVAGNQMTFPKARNTDRRDGKRDGEINHFWVGEEKEIGTARPGVDDFTLRLKKLAVVVFVTEELIADESYALQQYVTQKVRDELDFALGNSTIRGTAVLQPMGWLNSSCTVDVAKESLQAEYTIAAENILKMWSHRITGNDGNYVWLINQEVESLLPAMTLGTGNLGGLVYMPAGGLSGNQYATLMGAPIIVTEFNSGKGNRGDIMLVDYKQYKTISKGGVTETASPHVEFLRDQIAYKFTVRVDGRPCDDAPITPANGTTLQSACVTLADRLP